ncbi:2TM domain-containing protein [Maribacter algarum]|uniref:2TM domain-containing protein n=1 Tax=Maribacter algarum (ex Zhang et al. 2020) TaxID=2578118 RepID=A0A5S3QH53_9FLAO|nr:2TM domain-containing protein [Maribacter algarum]TMM56865.1 2TM domain-containing protein [Maribacter algarum]
MNYLENNEIRYRRAKERIEAIKGFYMNLFAYCIVIPFLAFLNYNTTTFPWVLFPMLGWGMGLLGQGLSAFGFNPLWNKNWEERKIQELMNDNNF